MRDARDGGAARRDLALFAALGVLVSWLVVQNAALLVLWSWPAMPALLTVARAMLKVAGIVAIQLAPLALIVAGVALLGWKGPRRTGPTHDPRLREVRHG